MLVSPLKIHPPIHEAIEVFCDETVVQCSVIDCIDDRRNNELKRFSLLVTITMEATHFSLGA